MQLIHVASGDYSQYEELLLKRDELEKETEFIMLEYTRIFGDITTEIFKLKIDCITLKKSISYCIMKKNHDEVIDPETLRKVIAEKMASYQAALDEMIRENERSKNTKNISAFQANEIKRIYRKIAKILHPDVSNVTEKYPALGELFQRVVVAYKCNDYKEIKELEVLVNRALSEIGEEGYQVVIPDIEEKIENLEEEIHTLMTTEPYTYNEFLNDNNLVEQKMKEFELDRDSYARYKVKLEAKLKEMLGDNNGKQ